MEIRLCVYIWSPWYYRISAKYNRPWIGSCLSSDSVRIMERCSRRFNGYCHRPSRSVCRCLTPTCQVRLSLPNSRCSPMIMKFPTRVLAQLELDFNSIERIVEYLDVPQEAPPIIEKNRPPAYWPTSDGSVVVQNLVIRYAPELPDALHRISFSTRPAEKLAVVRGHILCANFI
jgi:hypothetical protein